MYQEQRERGDVMLKLKLKGTEALANATGRLQCFMQPPQLPRHSGLTGTATGGRALW